MTKKILTICLLFLMPLPAISQVSVWGMKAEIWGELDQHNKVIYVQGVFDGLPFSNFKIHETKISMDISIRQYVTALDEMYSDYKNSLIPVPFLLRIITLELSGVGKDVIEEELFGYRRQFSGK
jgi:hypothetical protein